MKHSFEVLVPLRKGGPLLDECLASLVNQDGPGVPVTVIDDSSVDDTAERVAAWAERSPLVRYRRFDDPTNLAGNFNRCIKAAEADHFALVHVDDRVFPNYVQGVQDAIEQFPEAWLIFCQGALMDDDGKPIRTLKDKLRRRAYRRRGPILSGERGLTALASYNHLMAPCAIYRKDALPDDLRFDDTYTYLVDQTFWLNVLLAGGSIAQVPGVFYEHRVHTGQLSASLRGADSTLTEIESFAPALADHPRALAAWRRYGRIRAARNRVMKLLAR